MSWRQNQRASSINRINARSKYFDARVLVILSSGFFVCRCEPHLRARRFSDPVALHSDDPLWPSAFQQFQIVEQLLRISGSLQKPLLKFARFHQHIFVPPAVPVYHLFVRQHCAALGTPIHAALFPVGQPALQHAQEKPLIPPVIFRFTRRDFPPPIKTEPKAPQHPLKFCNVVVGPGSRVGIILNRSVFRGQAEGVPTHRMQHVESAHALHARHYIANRVVAHVPHVHRARGIRQHFQYVVLRLRRIRLRFEDPRIYPAFLPFCFDRLWVVFRHSQLSPFSFPARPTYFFCLFSRRRAFRLFRDDLGSRSAIGNTCHPDRSRPPRLLFCFAPAKQPACEVEGSLFALLPDLLRLPPRQRRRIPLIYSSLYIHFLLE